MSELQQTEATHRRRRDFKDEIELMDYLRVMWKWKYLIIAGSFICAIVGGVISFSMPKVYRINMVLQPGVLTINQAGKEVYVDSAQNMKALIEGGILDREILNSVSDYSNGVPPTSLKFKTKMPKGSDTLKVSYEASSKNMGLRILDKLQEGLSKRYDKGVASFQNEYVTMIALKEVEVANCEARKRSAEQHIKNIEKRIDALRSQIDFVRKNTASLLKLRDEFLSSNTSQTNMLAAVLHTNTIQQNIALQNQYGQEVDRCMSEREDKRLYLQELDSETKRLLEQIKELEFKKNNVLAIEVVQAPTATPHPVRPRTQLNVMLAGAVGLFVMLFLAFFLEYVQRHRAETAP
jgi:LPS O-antigen subunit length determinant protein (WzzB/FepE family)